MAARQQLLQPVLAAAQKVLEIGRPSARPVAGRSPTALSDPSPTGLRLDSSTASTVSSAGAQAGTPGLAYLHGFIGDRPGPYNAASWLEAAMPGPIIVNVNIGRTAVNAACAGDMSHRKSRRCRPVRPDARTRATSSHCAASIAAKRVSPSGLACTSVISSRSAIVHPLRIDFGAADHRDLSGQTPQRVAARNRAARRERCRHHAPGARKSGIARDDDIGAPGKRPAASTANVLRPITTGLPIVIALKRCMIGFQPPRHRIVAPITPFSATATMRTISGRARQSRSHRDLGLDMRMRVVASSSKSS